MWVAFGARASFCFSHRLCRDTSLLPRLRSSGRHVLLGKGWICVSSQANWVEGACVVSTRFGFQILGPCRCMNARAAMQLTACSSRDISEHCHSCSALAARICIFSPYITQSNVSYTSQYIWKTNLTLWLTYFSYLYLDVFPPACTAACRFLFCCFDLRLRIVLRAPFSGRLAPTSPRPRTLR